MIQQTESKVTGSYSMALGAELQVNHDYCIMVGKKEDFYQIMLLTGEIYHNQNLIVTNMKIAVKIHKKMMDFVWAIEVRRNFLVNYSIYEKSLGIESSQFNNSSVIGSKAFDEVKKIVLEDISN